jgi:hypothetical protein
MSNKEKAADYFNRHDGTECHITSDGRVFHSKGTADSFAVGLADQKVESFKKEDFAKAEKPKEEKPKVADAAKKGKVDFPTLELTPDNIKQILDFGLVKENYINLKALVAHLKIDAENQKAETLVKVLAEYKLKNQA